MEQPPYLVLPGTPLHDLFNRNLRGRPLALQQVMSPNRLAARMAEVGAQRAQPVAAPQANPGGFCQGAQNQVPFRPAMRFAHERVDFIQGEEEFWVERVLVVEQRNQEEADQIAEMRARLAEEQFFYHFSHEAQQHTEFTKKPLKKSLTWRLQLVSNFWFYVKNSNKPKRNVLTISVRKQDGLPTGPEPNLPRRCIIIRLHRLRPSPF